MFAERVRSPDLFYLRVLAHSVNVDNGELPAYDIVLSASRTAQLLA